MKTAFFAILLACATGAVGQVGYILSNQPQVFTIPDNPQHARAHTMAQDQNLRGDESPYTYAKGELPLSDFARKTVATPLGDMARNLRKEHAMARRATIVWAN